MLMRPKHPLDRLLALKASGVHELMGSFTAHPTQNFKLGAEMLDPDGMIIVIS